MNELRHNRDPRYIPTKFDRNPRSIALMGAVTALADQNN